MDELLLIDLGALFWNKWFSSRSQVTTLTEVINRVDFLATRYQYVVVCADSPSNWRFRATAHLDRELQYKANRPKKDEEALITLADTEDRLKALGYPLVKCDGYEADDVIATLTGQAGCDVFIASDDKDLYQLISKRVTQLTRGGEMGPEECKRKFGIYPDKMLEFLALVGDASDNIVGCKKVGASKAVLLLERFGSIEGIKAASVEDICDLKGIGETIAKNIEEWDPRLAIELITLATDCPVELTEIVANYAPMKMDDELNL